MLVKQSPDLWKQPFSVVRASGGYSGNAAILCIFRVVLMLKTIKCSITNDRRKYRFFRVIDSLKKKSSCDMRRVSTCPINLITIVLLRRTMRPRGSVCWNWVKLLTWKLGQFFAWLIDWLIIYLRIPEKHGLSSWSPWSTYTTYRFRLVGHSYTFAWVITIKEGQKIKEWGEKVMWK